MKPLRTFETSITLWTVSTYEKPSSGKQTYKEEDSQAAEYNPPPSPKKE
jgi:hypothetical protein